MIEHGVDYTLADVEGNTARELAVKNGQTKAARYLGQLLKHRVPKNRSGNMAVSPKLKVELAMISHISQNGLERGRSLSRSKHTKAEMIDNYRHAPPHQVSKPVQESQAVGGAS